MAGEEEDVQLAFLGTVKGEVGGGLGEEGSRSMRRDEKTA